MCGKEGCRKNVILTKLQRWCKFYQNRSSSLGAYSQSNKQTNKQTEQFYEKKLNINFNDRISYAKI